LVIWYYVITEKSSSWYLDVIAGITGSANVWICWRSQVFKQFENLWYI